jgi:hypothetical protein
VKWHWWYWRGRNDAKPVGKAVWRKAVSKKERGYFVKENGHWYESEYLVPVAALGEETKDMEKNSYEMYRMLFASGVSGGTGPFTTAAGLVTQSFLASSAYAGTYELTGVPSGDVSAERYVETTLGGTLLGTLGGKILRPSRKLIVSRPRVRVPRGLILKTTLADAKAPSLLGPIRQADAPINRGFQYMTFSDRLTLLHQWSLGSHPVAQGLQGTAEFLHSFKGSVPSASPQFFPTKWGRWGAIGGTGAALYEKLLKDQHTRE